MDGSIAVFLLILGLPSVIWPYELARFEERMDSIGSKRSWSDVEPATWKVTLTRIVGVGMTLVGAFGLLFG